MIDAPGAPDHEITRYRELTGQGEPARSFHRGARPGDPSRSLADDELSRHRARKARKGAGRASERCRNDHSEKREAGRPATSREPALAPPRQQNVPGTTAPKNGTRPANDNGPAPPPAA